MTGIDSDPDPLADILYIEDNATNAALVRRILARVPSVRLTISPNGLEGLEAARSVRPALVFLDLHLPDIDGEKVLAEIRAMDRAADHPARTSVIVLTADASRETRERVIAAGADRLITKPLQVDEIIAAAEAIAARVRTA